MQLKCDANSYYWTPDFRMKDHLAIIWLLLEVFNRCNEPRARAAKCWYSRAWWSLIEHELQFAETAWHNDIHSASKTSVLVPEAEDARECPQAVPTLFAQWKPCLTLQSRPEFGQTGMALFWDLSKCPGLRFCHSAHPYCTPRLFLHPLLLLKKRAMSLCWGIIIFTR